MWAKYLLIHGNFITMDPLSPSARNMAIDSGGKILYVDDLVTPLMSLVPRRAVPAGTVGLQAKGTTGTFGYVCVN